MGQQRAQRHIGQCAHGSRVGRVLAGQHLFFYDAVHHLTYERAADLGDR